MRGEFVVLAFILAFGVGFGGWWIAGRPADLAAPTDAEVVEASAEIPSEEARAATPAAEVVEASAEIRSEEARAATPAPDIKGCPDRGHLTGEWHFTTTVTGSKRNALGATGDYEIAFTRSDCNIAATVRKTGYTSGHKRTVFDEPRIQSGAATLDDISVESDTALVTVGVRLVRPDGSGVLSMRFRLSIGRDALHGEYRYAGGSWREVGMWGYAAGARPGVASRGRMRLQDQPCDVRCRIGCEMPRREVDDLPEADEFSGCVYACARTSSTDGCEPKGYSMETETLGGVPLGATPGVVGAAWGRSASTQKTSLVPATGELESGWVYPGERVVFAALPVLRGKPNWRVARLELKTASLRRTSRGIGIGDRRGAAERAYGHWITERRRSGSHLFVGKPESSLGFEFQGGRVSAIYLGSYGE